MPKGNLLLFISAFFILLLSLLGLSIYEKSNRVPSINPDLLTNKKYVDIRGEETPLGISTEKKDDYGNSYFTLTGVLLRIDEERDVFILKLATPTKNAYKFFNIDLGPENNILSDLEIKIISTLDSEITGTDFPVEFREIFENKSVREIHQKYREYPEKVIQVDILVGLNQGEESLPEGCDDVCKLAFSEFRKYQKINKNILAQKNLIDFFLNGLGFPVLYEIGSPVAIRLSNN